MKYKIVTLGKTKIVALSEISRNLKPSSEVYELSEPEAYLGPVSHNTLAFFLAEFAEYALQNYEKERIPEAEICTSLIRKWIRDNTSVSKEELKLPPMLLMLLPMIMVMLMLFMPLFMPPLSLSILLMQLLIPLMLPLMLPERVKKKSSLDKEPLSSTS